MNRALEHLHALDLLADLQGTTACCLHCLAQLMQAALWLLKHNSQMLEPYAREADNS